MSVAALPKCFLWPEAASLRFPDQIAFQHHKYRQSNGGNQIASVSRITQLSVSTSL
jgi:hypothetical protein